MFFEPPPDVANQIHEALQTRFAQAEYYRHAVQRFLDNLDEEDVQTFRHLMLNVAGDDTGRLASYYEGQASIIALTKYNICPGCGVNHDKEASELLGAHKPEESKPTQQPPDPERTIEFETSADDTPTSVFPNMAETVSKSDKELMELYHLDDLRDEDTHALLGFACTGIKGMRGPCGVVYPSIADRMLRDPESCSGCFIKMGQG